MPLKDVTSLHVNGLAEALYPSPPPTSPVKQRTLGQDENAQVSPPRKRCKIEDQETKARLGIQHQRLQRHSSRRRDASYSLIAALDSMTMLDRRARIKSSSFMPLFTSNNDTDVYKMWMLRQDDFAQTPPFAVAFSNATRDAYPSTTLAIADEDGNVTFLDPTESKLGHTTTTRQLKAHDNAVFDLRWSTCNRYVMTGSGDSTAKLWDAERLLPVANLVGHKASIKSVAFDPHNGFILATACRDGNIGIWDIRCSPTFNEGSVAADFASCRLINGAHRDPTSVRRRSSREAGVSATSVLFLAHQENMLLSAGAQNGTVKLWDIRSTGSSAFKSKPVPISCTPEPLTFPDSTAKREHGTAALTLDSTGTYLYQLCTDSRIYQYAARTIDTDVLPRQIFSHPDFNSSSFYVRAKVSPDDQVIVAGSTNGAMFAWETSPDNVSPSAPKAWRFHGHDPSKEVTAIDWTRASGEGYGAMGMIASASDDMTVRTWTSESVYAATPIYNGTFGYTKLA